MRGRIGSCGERLWLGISGYDGCVHGPARALNNTDQGVLSRVSSFPQRRSRECIYGKGEEGARKAYSWFGRGKR
eukprot:scaffold48867_cov33-Tisochrysis_lutea.AAC.2